MDPARFVASETGKLIRTIEKQFAFVPAPLPPRIDLGAIALKMSEAMHALGELKGASRRLHNHRMLVRPLQRNEALTSSAMEGTFTTDENLLLAEVGQEADRDESAREVSNYLSALTESLESLRDIPISHRLIRRAHEVLLSGLGSERGASKRPGEYKSTQNWIGGRKIELARFVPPPPAETQICMDELERYINRENTSFPTPLIDLALVHYQIESIHPFADGNGRVGRMIISLMAVHNGLIDLPIFYVSSAFERRKDEYIDYMFRVSTQGKWEDWLVFFFEIVCETCFESIKAIDKLISLQAEYKAVAFGLGRSQNFGSMVDSFFNSYAMTVPTAASALGITYPAAKKILERLAEAGILREIPDHYPKIFYAPEIMRVARFD